MPKPGLVKMFATKPMSYATRRLTAGDEFHCTPAHARVLEAIGKARPESGRPEGDVPPMPEALRTRALRAASSAVPPPPAELAAKLTGNAALFDGDGDGKIGGSTRPADPAGELTELRRKYTEVTGKRFYAGWDAFTLREKIDQHDAEQ